MHASEKQIIERFDQIKRLNPGVPVDELVSAFYKSVPLYAVTEKTKNSTHKRYKANYETIIFSYIKTLRALQDWNKAIK